MVSAAIRRGDRVPVSQESGLTRSDVLARYRRLREIGKYHNRKVLDFLPRQAVLQQARRLGIADGRTILTDSMDELTLAFDLAIHTATSGRTRAIDRYARSASSVLDADEVSVLEAMCDARFSIVVIQQRHPVAGLLVRDTLRSADLWLVDIGLEASLPDGSALATRYYQPDDFAVTAGVAIPISVEFIEIALMNAPDLRYESLADFADDRRFAECIYRAALASGLMESVSYEDPVEEIA